MMKTTRLRTPKDKHRAGRSERTAQTWRRRENIARKEERKVSNIAETRKHTHVRGLQRFNNWVHVPRAFANVDDQGQPGTTTCLLYTEIENRKCSVLGRQRTRLSQSHNMLDTQVNTFSTPNCTPTRK